ncbi:MAG: hypothetical protein WD598_14595 [Acidimicrobiia bacterium]
MIVLLVVGAAMPVHAQDNDRADEGRSPALCGPDDTPEPGIQGEVPAGETANFNCGLTLLAEIPSVGALQGADHCAYVRTGDRILVIDVSDSTNPTEVGSVPTFGASETMRAVVTDDRAVLVSGSGVYDISDCENPAVKGQILWPSVGLTGINVNLLPHDIRIDHGGNKVYASFGVWEVDITDLDDPSTWTITNHWCDVLAQYNPIHKQVAAADLSLCDQGDTGTFTLGANPLQASLLWPPMSHSPDTNEADTRLYVGDQSGGTSANWEPKPFLRVIDLTQDPPRVLAKAPGSGHSVDWFRTADGREFVLHANEAGIGDTCKRNRPEALGWAFDAVITEVTRDKAKRVSKLELAINTPKFCEAKVASGADSSIAHQMVANPDDVKFAAVSFGSAGLRVFDIRNPKKPIEVAYFNHGGLVHAGIAHYDASRGLLYVPSADGFKVLEIQPQVSEHLGLDE